MHKSFFVAFCLVLAMSSYAQEVTAITDTLAVNEKKWDVGIDIISRYIWRGQSWGGNYPAVQPSFNYAVSKKWTVGVWATTNFQKEYYTADDIPKGYQEFDFGISYQATDFLSVQVWDYYWPAFERFEGVDKNYFNYGPNGVKSVDATLVFDFSEHYRYAFNATISTLVAGNDYRYDSDGENPKQNFTTYIELGYTFSDILKPVSQKTLRNINLSPTIGSVLNNKAMYYTYGDYDKVSFVNLALLLNREFDLGHEVTMPVSLAFTHNAAKQNVEPFGRDFVVAGLSFAY